MADGYIEGIYKESDVATWMPDQVYGKVEVDFKVGMPQGNEPRQKIRGIVKAIYPRYILIDTGTYCETIFKIDLMIGRAKMRRIGKC